MKNPDTVWKSLLIISMLSGMTACGGTPTPSEMLPTVAVAIEPADTPVPPSPSPTVPLPSATLPAAETPISIPTHSVSLGRWEGWTDDVAALIAFDVTEAGIVNFVIQLPWAGEKTCDYNPANTFPIVNNRFVIREDLGIHLMFWGEFTSATTASGEYQYDQCEGIPIVPSFAGGWNVELVP